MYLFYICSNLVSICFVFTYSDHACNIPTTVVLQWPSHVCNTLVYICEYSTVVHNTATMYAYTAENPNVLCLQFAPGTLFVPRSNAPAQLDMASMQYVVHSNDADQQMHGQPLGHQYMPNDSMLFQHYADMDMAQSGGLRNLLQAETHGAPTANYGIDRGVAGKTPLHVLML